MTTKARAKKYRIRRRDVADSLALPAGDLVLPDPDAELQADNAMEQAMRSAASPEKPPAPSRTEKAPAPEKPTMQAAANAAAQRTAKPRMAKARHMRKGSKPDPDSDAAILAEGLTGRQLRIARRVANRHGLDPASDIEAVRMLRKKGIDPFTRETILDLVSDKSRKNLPQTVPQPQVASPEVTTEADIAREVRKIQQDIARRRRLKMTLLVARLAFFVLLPTALAGYYFFRMATPMFATHSEFVIQQAESQAGPGGLGGMFSGTMLATTQDAVAVQSYLTSREAMLRLDADLGFRDHFSSPEIDALQRLDADATYEDAYDIYRKRVKISFDPTEGIVRMEVAAADPQTSKAFSEALLSYAEQQVDDLTQRLRADQMRGARESFDDAETMVQAAQTRVLDLQQARGVLSADLEVSSLMSQISTLEVELNTEKLRLQELLVNAQPNQSRVAILEGNIARLTRLIEDLRGQMTEGGSSGASLARISGELVIAQADLETRQLMLSQALQQLETARIEANRQVRYLSTSVSPIAPDEASYPRAFENTFLAFLVFAGIYLMISLTASILREQVSS
ncbi:capsule polysaccharide export [Dinoroseobacter shibae DFL 12 = DSM 16493]|jgi:capsular polysaccharide transport system permease protein|uniref:Capsule polysaccharide export n=1 Tax=Dinoroseobacter shibae (strain DSM 16493 / NCIMB 14021 / DFL 12) TaxID=398580 RepID=A8LPK7_DINSH|nr:capsule polysaccharide transporter [Dinoroseobacter shibae]ABV92330.1 capsule polysaccharide export [Dinoroseobacter shibae DFL 12 = DSM 16493]URF47278.1 capsule biosynthesis protein [Dinoroseobacter shibae]URF51589.1 capsule biosynthesis protein [Dinoroseobacter shibae]